MRSLRRSTAWILILLLFCNPLVTELIAQENAALQATSQRKAEFEKCYAEIMAMEEVKLDFLTSGAMGLADLLKGDKMGTAKAKIEEANQAIRQAKQQAQATKSLLELQTLKASNTYSGTRGVQDDLAGTSKAKATLQKAFREVGTKLVEMGTLMQNISLVFGVATAALMVLGPLTAGATIPFALTTLKICAVVGAVGAGLAEAGQSLIAASQKGANTDNAVLGAIVRGGVVAGISYFGGRLGGAVATRGAGLISQGLGKVLGRTLNLPSSLEDILVRGITHSNAYTKMAENTILKTQTVEGAKALNAVGLDKLGITDTPDQFKKNVLVPTLDLVVPRQKPGLGESTETAPNPVPEPTRTAPKGGK